MTHAPQPSLDSFYATMFDAGAAVFQRQTKNASAEALYTQEFGIAIVRFIQDVLSGTTLLAELQKVALFESNPLIMSSEMCLSAAKKCVNECLRGVHGIPVVVEQPDMTLYTRANVWLGVNGGDHNSLRWLAGHAGNTTEICLAADGMLEDMITGANIAPSPGHMRPRPVQLFPKIAVGRR